MWLVAMAQTLSNVYLNMCIEIRPPSNRWHIQFCAKRTQHLHGLHLKHSTDYVQCGFSLSHSLYGCFVCVLFSSMALVSIFSHSFSAAASLSIPSFYSHFLFLSSFSFCVTILCSLIDNNLTSSLTISVKNRFATPEQFLAINITKDGELIRFNPQKDISLSPSMPETSIHTIVRKSTFF